MYSPPPHIYIFALILWTSLTFFFYIPGYSSLVEYLMYIWKGYVATLFGCYIPTSWLIMLFKSSMSLLIYFKLSLLFFDLLNLPVTEREMLKLPTKIEDLYFYLICIRLCFLLFEVLLLYNLGLLSHLENYPPPPYGKSLVIFLFSSQLFVILIQLHSFFFFWLQHVFVCCIFVHSFTFNLVLYTLIHQC